MLYLVICPYRLICEAALPISDVHFFFGPQKGSQRADEYIRMIKDNLEVAVEQCIEAAGHEIEPATQKSLLRVGV